MATSITVDKGLIYPALRKAGVTLGPGRTPSPAQYQDGLDELNRLLGSFDCDRLFIYSISRYEYPLTAAKSYTIGIDPQGVLTANFNGPRPIQLTAANIMYGTPQIRRPLEILTYERWSQIRVQDQPGTIPWAIYDDYAYPLSTLYLYPQAVPGYLLELYMWQQVPAFVQITDLVVLPPGYEDALVLNLAVRLASQFQRQIDPIVVRDAQLSMMRLESINAPKPIAETGFGCTSGYMNVYTGEIK